MYISHLTSKQHSCSHKHDVLYHFPSVYINKSLLKRRNWASAIFSVTPMKTRAQCSQELKKEKGVIMAEVKEEVVFQSDLDFAFELQVEEAMNESLISTEDITEQLSTIKTLEMLKSLEQEENDRKLWEAEKVRTREDLKRRLHDRKVAGEIFQMSDVVWRNTGDHFERPFGEATSSSSSATAADDGGEAFKLYFKGLFGVERVGGSMVMIAGVGGAICDPLGNEILNVQRPLIGDWKGDWNDQNLEFKVEVQALIECLDAALALDIKKIDFYCDYFPLYQYITMRQLVNDQKIAREIDQVYNLQKRFVSCLPFYVARKDVKFAFKLARGAINSQITRSAESSSARNLKETCTICLEETSVDQMFSIDRCMHRYCYSCMNQHVEVKLLDGIVPQCPAERCNTQLNIHSSRKFLSPKLVDMMNQRLMEDSIPMTEKLYCPYPRCSALMSKKVLEYANNVFIGANESGVRKCIKCHGKICINCKVPWHDNMTCDTFKRQNPETGDAKAKSLATQNHWRQCIKCNHMIELREGCYHITCRCGYEFCYRCGAEWQNKKATCTCPIWDEANIIRNQRRRQ